MTFRTRLLTGIMLVVVVSNLLLFSLLYVKTHDALFKEIQNNALSIVASSSVLIDGDLLARITRREDEESEVYGAMVEQLRRIRDANRRKDTRVAFLYTMMNLPGNPNVLVFGVDSEEKLEDKSHVGDVYKGTFGGDFKISDRNFVDDVPSRDQWGEWITACSPVKNSGGQVVSMLCADLGFADVKDKTTTRLVTSGAVSLAVTVCFALLIAHLLSRRIGRPIQALVKSMTEIGRGNFDERMGESSTDEFGQVATTLNEMVEGLRQRDMLKGVFARYVSDKILDKMLQRGELPGIQGDRRKVTVLFSDIRNFTALSEQLSPEDVVLILNEYFEAMVDIIFKHQGTLDKFMGDGMMVVFGAPEDDPYQEEHAIRAALEMSRELKRLCTRWKYANFGSIGIGIGINTGTAIVGNIGSHRHMEYTAIGDTVNLASRIEALTKTVGHSILVTEYTYVTVRNLFRFRRIDECTIKGKRDMVTIHAVLDEEVEQLPVSHGLQAEELPVCPEVLAGVPGEPCPSTPQGYTSDQVDARV